MPTLILMIFMSPILIILLSLFSDYSENWEHIYNYVLTDYIVSSFILVSGVSTLVIIIGSVTAWVVTNYQFVGRRFFEWGLILPLAIPPYILAYTFTGLFDSYGTLNEIAGSIFNLQQSESPFSKYPKYLWSNYCFFIYPLSIRVFDLSHRFFESIKIYV